MHPESRRRTALRLTAFVVAALCTALVVLAATARDTVLSASFHENVLDEEHAYDRLYDQVLVDPQAAGVTRELLAGLPVPESVVTANVKLVLPPETLRALTRQQLANLTAYLSGERDTLAVTVDLRPVLSNVNDLAQVYFGDLVAAVQQREEPDFDAFADTLEATVREVVAGRAPDSLPVLPLNEEQARRATDVLLRVLPRADRAALRDEVEMALSDGDIASALATVGPVAVADRTEGATARLTQLTGGTGWDVEQALEDSGADLSALHRVREWTSVGLGVVEALAAALLVAALAVLWATTGTEPGTRSTLLGWVLAAGGATTALAVVVVRAVVGDRLVAPPDGWPPALAALVDDLQHRAVTDAVTAALAAAFVPVVAGALLTGLGWVLRTRPRFRLRVRMRYVRIAAAGTSAVTVAALVLVPLLASPDAPRRCEGSARLCDRRYDDVAYLTAHNAMASTVNRFVGPLQDPSITGQLDHGVRALQLDVYHWERPEEITGRLDESDFTAEQREFVATAVDRANPRRPGLWLCHAVCRAGALPLVPTLEEIGEWLRDHPDEVVTLILQDRVPGAEIAEAFTRAGLSDLLFTPDADPSRPWPTLGEMIDSGRRLVVFAERADGPVPWLRNLYAYGMETPFSFSSPDEMSCVPHRGGTGKRLFLLNHFVTENGGSRLDAGRVNSRAFLLDRAERCGRERGRPVTFVAVDYVTIGDAKGAVDALNERRTQEK
jgi:hypothetical protein